MIQENLNLKWSCQTRVDTSKELLILMKSAGCELVAFGVESGSQKVLNTIKKGTTVTKVREAFKICKEIGMRTKAFLIVGLPSEEKEDFEMSIKLVKEINPDYLWVSKFSPVPGSEYYEKHKEELKDMKWTDYSYFYGKVSNEVEKRHKKIVNSFYLRPAYIISFLKRFSWMEFVYMIRIQRRSSYSTVIFFMACCFLFSNFIIAKVYTSIQS